MTTPPHECGRLLGTATTACHASIRTLAGLFTLRTRSEPIRCRSEYSRIPLPLKKRQSPAVKFMELLRSAKRAHCMPRLVPRAQPSSSTIFLDRRPAHSENPCHARNVDDRSRKLPLIRFAIFHESSVTGVGSTDFTGALLQLFLWLEITFRLDALSAGGLLRC